MDAPHSSTDRWSRYTPFLVWLPLLACFAAIQFGTDRLGGNDGWYHVKYAWLLWHEGAIWDFPWLRGTFFHESWVDTEFLYHVLLIPFTIPGDLYLAGKIAPAIFGSIAIFSVYWVIREFGEPGSEWRKHSWWAALLLMTVSHVALYRLSMPRVPAPSLTCMMIALLLMNRGLWKWLAVLGFFYAWMYPVSIVLIPLAFFHALGRWYDEDKWDFKMLAAVSAGVAAGFIINPYFPRTLPILFNHVVEIGMGASDIPKGNEWGPYDSWFMFTNAKIAWTALFLGGLSMVGTPSRGRHIMLLAATAMMMLAYMKSRRFVEYWPFFSVLFSAAVFHDALQAPGSLVDRLRKLVGPKGVALVQIGLTAFLVGTTVRSVRRATRDIGTNAMPTRLAGAAGWLRENTLEGTQVYNVEWDIFPELISYNHHNHWTLGLDPNFTYEVSPNLYHMSVAIAEASTLEPGRYIRKDFGARYVLATNKAPFTKAAKRTNSGFKLRFSDAHASVFEVMPINDRYTIEGELDAVDSSLSPDTGRCRYNSEANKGITWKYLRCELREAKPFTLRYTAEIPAAGNYTVAGRFLSGPSLGQTEVLVGGQPVGGRIDLANDERKMLNRARLATISLKAGPVPVEIRMFPQMPDPVPTTRSGKPKKYPVESGFDALRFGRVK